jgi:metabolite-proton symporter
MASAIGTTIEWYDFFLYNTAAALVFPHLFFPASSAYVGAMQSFATYAVGFAARPVGAAIFGHWGDRIGRKATLIVTLLVMGIASALVGMLPKTATIGLAAPLLLVALRLIQGLAIGGEWSGSVLIAMEWGDQRKRGLLGSFAQLGVPLGLVLGTGGMTLLSATLSPEAFTSWGWRVPFLLSLVLVAVGLVIRLKILETPMFAKVQQDRKTARVPVIEVIRHHWREILLSAGLRFSEQMPFYLFTTFVLIYVVSRHGFSKTFGLNAVLVGALCELVAIPFFSQLSDRLGRKHVYLTGAVLTALIAFPYFAVLTQSGAVLIFVAVVVSLQVHATQYGPQAALIGESFPTHLRYGGAGLGYQLASVFAGGPAPLIATWLYSQYGSAYAVAGYILACAVITLIACAMMNDYTGKNIEGEYE